MTRNKVRLLVAVALAFAASGSYAQEQKHYHMHDMRPVAGSGIAEGSLKNGVRIFELSVTDDGFVPARLKVNAGETVRLVVTRKTDGTCAKEIVIKDKGINQPLPLNKAVTVEFKADRSGEVRYACGMDHVSGVVFVK